MLNQDRVEEMIRLAILDENDGKKCRPMILYFRKDYIAKELLKSFVTGTLAFLLLAGIWMVCQAQQIVDSLNSMDLQKVLTEAAVSYVTFMAVYSGITYVIYYRRYSAGRQKLKKYYMHLKRVNRLYHQEENS